MEVVNNALDRRGSQFYAFNEQTFTREFSGKNSKKSLKYSESYDIVFQMALLGSIGLTEMVQT